MIDAIQSVRQPRQGLRIHGLVQGTQNYPSRRTRNGDIHARNTGNRRAASHPPTP